MLSIVNNIGQKSMSVRIAAMVRQVVVLRKTFLQKGSAATVILVVVGCIDLSEQFVPHWLHMGSARTHLDVESMASSSDSWGAGRRIWYENEAFPDINSVPSHPPSAAPTIERRAIMEELLTDRANAYK